MFRALLLASAASIPFLLLYAFGPWVMFALGALVAATFLFSTGRAHENDAERGGRLTGYETTLMGGF